MVDRFVVVMITSFIIFRIVIITWLFIHRKITRQPDDARNLICPKAILNLNDGPGLLGEIYITRQLVEVELLVALPPHKSDERRSREKDTQKATVPTCNSATKRFNVHQIKLKLNIGRNCQPFVMSSSQGSQRVLSACRLPADERVSLHY